MELMSDEVGLMLERSQSFNASGRCSAADAISIRRMREEKLFKPRADTWEAFCPKYLGITKTQANRIIRWLDAFGPNYFRIAEITPIKPDHYRAIATAVSSDALHWNGEAIPLIPDNSERIAAAVIEIRRAFLASDPRAMQFRLRTLEREFRLMTTHFQELAELARPEDRLRLAGLLSNAQSKLARLELEMES